MLAILGFLLKINDEHIRLVIFEEDGWVIVQCLEYDIVAQARTVKDAILEWKRIIVSRGCIAKYYNLGIFDNIPPAPNKYCDMYDNLMINIYNLKGTKNVEN